jgi:hypothetical protein
MGTQTKKTKNKTMKITNMKTMKSIYILAALLGLQFNTIFASGNFSESPVLSNEVVNGITATMLAPTTPAEATFEADFSDGAPVTEIHNFNLAPVTPKEADFEDENGTNNASSIRDLAPVTPNDADFEDHV